MHFRLPATGDSSKFQKTRRRWVSFTGTVQYTGIIGRTKPRSQRRRVLSGAVVTSYRVSSNEEQWLWVEVVLTPRNSCY